MRNMVATLDTHGGHMLVSVVMIFTGAVFLKLGIAEGRDLIVAFAAIIGRSMYGSTQRNEERANPPTSPAPPIPPAPPAPPAP